MKVDKFTGEIEPILPNFRYSEPSEGGFLFKNANSESMKDAGTEVIHVVLHRYWDRDDSSRKFHSF